LENYFNYFTEIEECFRKCRGTPTRLSTLDWALIESWKASGIPLEAVLTGVERAFQKYSKRPQRFRKINGLGYCSPEVFVAAAELKTSLVEGGTRTESQPHAEAPFDKDEICAYLKRGAEALDRASGICRRNEQKVVADDLEESAALVREIASQGEWTTDTEDLEQRLSALEEKLTAALTRGTSVDLLADIRREVERGLVSYRQKMTGAQLESLQRQFLKKRLFERYEVPRLSLFYM
jgi:hypothetical protein